MAKNRKVEILNHITTLGVNAKEWSKELNIVSWNGNPAKFDIREWSPDHSAMGRGVTMTQDEFDKLKDSLDKISSDLSLVEFDEDEDI